MFEAKSYVALLCSVLLLAPSGAWAAGDKPDAPRQDNATIPPVKAAPNHGFLNRLRNPYREPIVAPPTTGNSGRLDALLRGGNLYLSLQDAIALTLENNLDIAIQRYGPALADAVVLQAEAGTFARGVSTNVTAGPSGVSVSSSGTTPGTNQTAVSQASSATTSAGTNRSCIAAARVPGRGEKMKVYALS